MYLDIAIQFSPCAMGRLQPTSAPSFAAKGIHHLEILLLGKASTYAYGSFAAERFTVSPCFSRRSTNFAGCAGAAKSTLSFSAASPLRSSNEPGARTTTVVSAALLFAANGGTAVNQMAAIQLSFRNLHCIYICDNSGFANRCNACRYRAHALFARNYDRIRRIFGRDRSECFKIVIKNYALIRDDKGLVHRASGSRSHRKCCRMFGNALCSRAKEVRIGFLFSAKSVLYCVFPLLSPYSSLRIIAASSSMFSGCRPL